MTEAEIDMYLRRIAAGKTYEQLVQLLTTSGKAGLEKLEHDNPIRKLYEKMQNAEKANQREVAQSVWAEMGLN